VTPYLLRLQLTAAAPAVAASPVVSGQWLAAAANCLTLHQIWMLRTQMAAAAAAAALDCQ
jgi:hypothetical protein